MCIPVRRYPFGPPFCVQFRGTAELLRPEDPGLAPLLRDRRLKPITSHGQLDDPDSWFVRLVPDRRISTYGIGVPLRTLLRDPINGSRTIDVGPPAGAPGAPPARSGRDGRSARNASSSRRVPSSRGSALVTGLSRRTVLRQWLGTRKAGGAR